MASCALREMLDLLELVLPSGIYLSWRSLTSACAVATSLPDVYDKVKMDMDKFYGHKQTRLQRLLSLWPIPGLIGIWSAVQSKDYLLHRRSD